MDIHECWRAGKQLGAWVSQSSRFEPVVHVQGNTAALESLADVLHKLAKAAVGERVVLDTMTGLNSGDVALSLEHTNHLAPPPAVELLETRVALPDEGDMILWTQVPDAKREDVIRYFMTEAGHTSLQAREAIARNGICSLRMQGDLAVRLRAGLRRIGVDSALFELRS